MLCLVLVLRVRVMSRIHFSFWAKLRATLCVRSKVWVRVRVKFRSRS